MKSLLLHLHSVQDVRDFVNIAAKYEFPISAHGRNGVVDAKSMIGLFTVDLHKPVQIEFDAPDSDALCFCSDVGKFCAEA